MDVPTRPMLVPLKRKMPPLRPSSGRSYSFWRSFWTFVLRYGPAAAWVAIFYSKAFPWEQWAQPVSPFLPMREFWKRQLCFVVASCLHFDTEHLWKNVVAYVACAATKFSDCEVQRGEHLVLFFSGHFIASGLQFMVHWYHSRRISPSSSHRTVSWMAEKLSPNVLSHMYAENLSGLTTGGASSGIYSLLGWFCARSFFSAKTFHRGLAVALTFEVLGEILPSLLTSLRMGPRWVHPLEAPHIPRKVTNTMAHGFAFVAGAILERFSMKTPVSWWWPIASWVLGVVLPFIIIASAGNGAERPTLYGLASALITVFAGRPVAHAPA